MKEWMTLRQNLYQKRKDYMLAKLKKELEILRNKVRFIKAVIEETIVIKRVKRQAICRELKRQGFLTMSELNQIQSDKKKATLIVDDGQVKEDDQEPEEELRDGDIPTKEYDYLLTMPLWSLSDEKIQELNKQASDKKDDHDTLEGTHIFKIWERDLESFLEALKKQEDKDEVDRLSHKGMVGGGKKKGRAKAAVKKQGTPKKAGEAAKKPQKKLAPKS